MPIKALIISPTYKEKKNAWSILKFTRNDAEDFKKLLVETLQVSPTNITFLDPNWTGSSIYEPWMSIPDIDNMLNASKKIIDNLKNGDTFVFFFSGHGFEQNGIKLIPQFCLKTNINRTAFDLKKDLLEYLTNSKKEIRTLFIIDACRDTTGIKGDLSISNQLHNLLQDNKITGILACSQSEVSIESDKLKKGVFTHFLIESFEEFALFNNNKTILDLYKSIREKVSSFTNGKQNPDLIIDGGDPLNQFIPSPKLTNKERILKLLERHPNGLTDKQIQNNLDMNGNSQRPARLDLQKKGKIVTEKTTDGEKVWVLDKFAKSLISKKSSQKTLLLEE